MCFVNVSGLLSIQVALAAEKTRRVLKNAMAQNSLWATDCRECLPLPHELPELRVRLLRERTWARDEFPGPFA